MLVFALSFPQLSMCVTTHDNFQSEELRPCTATPLRPRRIPGEISESTGMKFISHMAASAPPNHNLGRQFNPAVHRLPPPPPQFRLPPKLPRLAPPPSDLPPPPIVLRQPLTSLGPDRKQLTPPTVITVMAIRESVTSSPRCDSIWPNPPCSTPTFWPGRWGSWVGWRWDTGRGVGVCDLTD